MGRRYTHSIHKGGNINEPKNYRGITLNKSKWAEKHNTLIDNQYGFQKGKTTVDCIFILHALITKTLANKKKLYTALLDFEKMFDKIDRIYNVFISKPLR